MAWPIPVFRYCTTGYLVRLIAHHPAAFKDHTHLVIDEVHERSIDADLLCYMAKRLLTENPRIKLVLMSATVHTDLYATYFRDFDVGPSIFVGARRYPVSTYFAEDLAEAFELPKRLRGVADRLAGVKKLSGNLFNDQTELVVYMSRLLCQPGSAALIFVSGIDGITTLTERFQESERYKVFAIHSTIPFEEQLGVFDELEAGFCKIIIATNAAESSLTLPDVDYVFCLGTAKQVQISQGKHAMLVNTFISQASATQRSGRTGRVRPGTAFRLYGKSLHDSWPTHDVGEILRIPLEDVVLQLKDMFDGGPIMETMGELLEPPDISTIQGSFETLNGMQMLTEPSDDGAVTMVGQLATRLPVDLRVGYMLALSIQMGVVPEAILIAAATASPRSPFRFASPLCIPDCGQLNEVIRIGVMSRHKFDQGLYSEPMMMVNLLSAWSRVPSGSRPRWCVRHGLVHRVLMSIAGTAKAIRRVMSSHMHKTDKSLEYAGGPAGLLARAKTVALLRVLLVWACPDGLAEADGGKKLDPGAASRITVTCPDLEAHQLASLFPKCIDWSLTFRGARTFNASRIESPRFDAVEELLLTPCMPDVLWVVEHGLTGAEMGTPGAADDMTVSRVRVWLAPAFASAVDLAPFRLAIGDDTFLRGRSSGADDGGGGGGHISSSAQMSSNDARAAAQRLAKARKGWKSSAYTSIACIFSRKPKSGQVIVTGAGASVTLGNVEALLGAGAKIEATKGAPQHTVVFREGAMAAAPAVVTAGTHGLFPAAGRRGEHEPGVAKNGDKKNGKSKGKTRKKEERKRTAPRPSDTPKGRALAAADDVADERSAEEDTAWSWVTQPVEAVVPAGATREATRGFLRNRALGAQIMATLALARRKERPPKIHVWADASQTDTKILECAGLNTGYNWKSLVWAHKGCYLDGQSLVRVAVDTAGNPQLLVATSQLLLGTSAVALSGVSLLPSLRWLLAVRACTGAAIPTMPDFTSPGDGLTEHEHAIAAGFCHRWDTRESLTCQAKLLDNILVFLDAIEAGDFIGEPEGIPYEPSDVDGGGELQDFGVEALEVKTFARSKKDDVEPKPRRPKNLAAKRH